MSCFSGPPGVGKATSPRPSVTKPRTNFQVLYRSIFEPVRDFMKDEAFNQQDRTLRP